MKIINEASDKFKDNQDEVCGCLFELLRLINELERSVFQRDCIIREKAMLKEMTVEEAENARQQMWVDYRTDCGKIVMGRCTEKLLKYGYARSFAPTPMYEYIEGDCEVFFRMSAPKKAVVEIVIPSGTAHLIHTFTMMRDGEAWLADAFTYGTDKENVRHRGHI